MGGSNPSKNRTLTSSIAEVYSQSKQDVVVLFRKLETRELDHEADRRSAARIGPWLSFWLPGRVHGLWAGGHCGDSRRGGAARSARAGTRGSGLRKAFRLRRH